MKRILIGVFLTLQLTAYSQESDSAQVRSILKWKLDKLLDNYFYDMPACTLAVDKFKQSVDSLKFAVTAGQTLIDLRTNQRDLKVNEVIELRKASEASKEAHRIREKQQRKLGRIEGIGLSGIVAIALVILL